MHACAYRIYPTRRMVNAYTEFLRVEQELSLYGHISGKGEARGARERETRNRDEESGRCRLSARENRETLFSASIYAHVLQTRARRIRDIKKGDATAYSPNCNSTLAHPLAYLPVPPRSSPSSRTLFHSPSGILGSFPAKRPLCRSYFTLLWGLPRLPGPKAERRRERRRR